MLERPVVVTTPPEGEQKLSIGEVVELLSAEYPDVTHSSLRFLEREGLITPQRTAGGHRLFGASQLRRIRSIKAWQRQRLSLEEIRARLRRVEELPPPAMLAEQFLACLVAGDREAAQQIVLNADELSMPLATIFDEILRPMLLEPGERHTRATFTAGQEREIAAFARDLIVLLGSRHQNDRDLRHQTIIAGCVEGEFYELALRMVTALLRADGFTVHYLGPNVEADWFVERVNARRPEAVLLSATHGDRVATLVTTVDALQAVGEDHFRPFVILAGQPVVASDELPAELEPFIVDDSSMQAVVTRVERALRERDGT